MDDIQGITLESIPTIAMPECVEGNCGIWGEMCSDFEENQEEENTQYTQLI